METNKIKVELEFEWEEVFNSTNFDAKEYSRIPKIFLYAWILKKNDEKYAYVGESTRGLRDRMKEYPNKIKDEIFKEIFIESQNKRLLIIYKNINLLINGKEMKVNLNKEKRRRFIEKIIMNYYASLGYKMLNKEIDESVINKK